MSKTLLRRPALLWAFIPLVAILTVVACRKRLNENSKPAFSQSEAKEWYYSVFKKSQEWQSSKDKGKKLPDWEHGTYRKVGDMEIVEFPLIKEKYVFAIPGGNTLSVDDMQTIANGSLSRIAFVRKAQENVSVRELDYIPDKAFLQAKHYDISSVQLGNGNSEFTGRIITKKWDGTTLSNRVLKKGKITASGRRIDPSGVNLDKNKSVQTKAKSKNAKGGVQPMSIGDGSCGLQEICEYERECEEVRQGDVWVPTGNCTEWEPTGYCYVVEDCDEGECDYSQSESCECQLYSVGCEPSEHEPDPEQPQPPKQKTPCDNADSLKNNQNFKDFLAGLKAHTGEKKEYGAYYSWDNGNLLSNQFVGLDSTAALDFPTPPIPIDGFAHTHYDSLLSVFSPDDLFAFASLYKNGKVADPKTFTFSVITGPGTQYMLMINDTAQFRSYATNLVTNNALNEYSLVYGGVFGIKSTNTNEVNELKFLQYLQTTNSGLKLFKGNGTFSEWNPIKASSSATVVNNPCN